MLKTTLFFLAMTLLASSQAQKGNSDIVIGTKETIHSKILGEKREVWVHVPQNLKKKNTANRYPVVYVLDGEQHFLALSGLVHQLSATNGNTICPEMIVVAVMNPDRARDLTVT